MIPLAAGCHAAADELNLVVPVQTVHQLNVGLIHRCLPFHALCSDERDLVLPSIAADRAGGATPPHDVRRRSIGCSPAPTTAGRARMNYSKFNADWQPGAGVAPPG